MAEQLAESKMRGTIHISVSENVSLENLHGIITKIAGMTGCRTCGIMGVDLRLSGDPVEFQQIAKIPGVKSITQF